MSAINTLPAYIDSSMLVLFRSCPRKFYWEHILCLRPTGRSIDLVAGGAFAAALEAVYVHYYSARPLDNLSEERMFDAYKAGLKAFDQSWGDFPHEPERAYDGAAAPAKTYDRTFQAVLDYFSIYPIASDHVRPLLRYDGRPTFEFSFAIPLVDSKFPRHPDTNDPFLYTGRFDAFGELDGRLVIRDEKTSGRAPSRNWASQWDLRNQFLGYVWACQQSNYDTSTVVVRNITIQKTQFQHAEAIKIYPQPLIEKFSDQLARDLHRLCDCYSTNYFDYNFGDTCNAYNRPCAFTDLCSAEDPSVWFNDYRRERWNPLTRSSDPVELAA